MQTGAAVIADAARVQVKIVVFRRFFIGKRLLVPRCRRIAAQKLGRRVCPVVARRRRHVYIARRNAREQVVLVKRQRVRFADILPERFAEPERKLPINIVKLLAFFAAEQRRTGTAGIVRVAKREAGIQRSSEQCRFAEARMPAHNGFCAVQPLVVLGIIHAAHRRPRPQCDFTRVMRRAFAVFIQNTRKAGGEVAVVARHILIAERKHRKAVVDEFLRRHVAVRHIASEVDVDKKRVRPLCGRHSQIHREREIFAVYHNAKRQLFQRRLARAEIIRNAGLRFPNERFRRLRQAAVFLPLQKLQHLRARF